MLGKKYIYLVYIYRRDFPKATIFVVCYHYHTPLGCYHTRLVLQKIVS